jgi:hypothetical protein
VLVKGVGACPDHPGSSLFDTHLGAYFFLIKCHLVPPRLVKFFLGCHVLVRHDRDTKSSRQVKYAAVIYYYYCCWKLVPASFLIRAICYAFVGVCTV